MIYRSEKIITHGDHRIIVRGMTLETMSYIVRQNGLSDVMSTVYDVVMKHMGSKKPIYEDNIIDWIYSVSDIIPLVIALNNVGSEDLFELESETARCGLYPISLQILIIREIVTMTLMPDLLLGEAPVPPTSKRSSQTKSNQPRIIINPAVGLKNAVDESLDKNDMNSLGDWYKSLHRMVSLLRSEGHIYPEKYSIGLVMNEHRIIVQRKELDQLNLISKQRYAIASLFDRDSSKEYSKDSEEHRRYINKLA